MSTKPCTVCAAPTASKKRLCQVHNPFKRKRRVTATEAWCPKGQHMVEHAGFAKNQQTCRACRKAFGYNDKSNFSQGKTCADCGLRVANTNRGGRCQKCRTNYIRTERPQAFMMRSRRVVDLQGYVVITNQWLHPNCDKRGHIKEHTIVMSKMLGRALFPGENVHHINGIKTDNRPENLELWVGRGSQPAGQRPQDLVAWAWEIIDRYDARDSKPGLFVVREAS